MNKAYCVSAQVHMIQATASRVDSVALSGCVCKAKQHEQSFASIDMIDDSGLCYIMYIVYTINMINRFNIISDYAQ